MIISSLDVPSWKNVDAVTYQTQEAYFTATLQLEDMFDGRGVPLDHYIIRIVNDDAEIEIPGPTYSMNISLHASQLVCVSAHNCAGYSDFVTLQLKNNQGQILMTCRSL